MEIIVNIPDEKKDEDYWVIPFNDIKPVNTVGAPFFYLRNLSEMPIKLKCISISSTGKNSSVQVHSVLGEPEFTREFDVKPVNKNTWRNGSLPDIEVKTCDNITEVYSNGQLDRLELPVENTTYKTKSNITIGSNSIVVITADTEGKMSGIVTISQEIEVEEE